eukprot:54651-Chlamydomonas_euryale.AAC.1
MAEESWQQLLKMCWALPSSSGKEGSGWPGWHRGSHPCSPAEAPVKPCARPQAGPGNGPKWVWRKDLCHTQVRPGRARDLSGRNRVRPG